MFVCVDVNCRAADIFRGERVLSQEYVYRYAVLQSAKGCVVMVEAYKVGVPAPPLRGWK